MSASNAPPFPGRTLCNGRYQIRKELGKGGFGAVYLAEDLRLGNRMVAIKELTNSEPEARQLFEREATLLATLNHPGLVKVSDYFSEGPTPCLVMDYIEGHDLLEKVVEAERNRTFIPAEQVTQWMIQICDAVAYLHQRKPPIIHRDIKPNNVRLTPQGQAILVDFGIAKIDPKARTMALAKAVSVGFSPPEQYAGGGGTDLRSDVYALGATFYCLLTNQIPPEGSSRLLHDTPLQHPREINSAILPEVENVVLKAMTLNSLHRYQDANEMLGALQAAAGEPTAPARKTPPSGKICNVCGTAARREANFCPACGANIKAPALCPVCGHPHRPSVNFCISCGTALTPGRVQPKDQAAARNKQEEGDRYLQANQPTEAAQAYESALKLGGEDPCLLASLGHCYIRLKRSDDAISLLEGAAQHFSQSAEIHALLAEAYRDVDKLSQCVQTMELAYQLEPDNAGYAATLAGFFSLIGKHSKAIPVLERAVSIHPQDLNLRMQLARTYLNISRPVEAEIQAREALRLKPDNADSYFLMGMVSLRRSEEAVALQHFQQAIALDASHALAHYFIGEIHFEHQNYLPAVEEYLACARANPGEADAHARLCQCYTALNRLEEARLELQQALQIDPGHELARQMALKLSS